MVLFAWFKPENGWSLSKLGNAGLIRDQRYRTDPDAGMPMPD